jgi:hypothetical protein
LLPKLRAVDLITSHQFEEEIGAASSENWLFIVKMEFSVRTAVFGGQCSQQVIGLSAPMPSALFSNHDY